MPGADGGSGNAREPGRSPPVTALTVAVGSFSLTPQWHHRLWHRMFMRYAPPVRSGGNLHRRYQKEV